MFNSVRVTRLTTNLYTRRVHLVCCIDKSFSRYHTSYCFRHITTKREKVLKIGLHFSSNSFFLEIMLSANKKENENMHTIYFSKYLASKKSILKTCFPLSLYLHWYNNFEHEQR